ncbi:Aldehyde/histidinol dehydrogenase [Suillus subalutaceus]|uniref:Aldehyde/histidinol dehydrogenase n=1 Tax=Suillus subalutaceus TaxID=48586 RepID=UPI001B85DF6E|nr:Aldehyde/histidinol dehydrogenase [Suillus subalutaceus]KAG1869412.1 Aldehyde/histidinol dehydrogenase [Suillus subalutaceus]
MRRTDREFWQICVAPDYVLVQRDKQDELVKAFQKHYNAFFPKGALDSPLFGSIVSDSHYKRLTSLLSRTKGEVVLQGRADAARRRLEPTIVKDVVDGDSLLEEEILGPILPIVPVDSLQQAISFVNARSHPLVSLMRDDVVAIACTKFRRSTSRADPSPYDFAMYTTARLTALCERLEPIPRSLERHPSSFHSIDSQSSMRDSDAHWFEDTTHRGFLGLDEE